MFKARVDAVETAERLRYSISLYWYDSIEAIPQSKHMQKEFDRDKREVARNHRRPLTLAGSQSCMEAAECPPFLIDVFNVPEASVLTTLSNN